MTIKNPAVWVTREPEIAKLKERYNAVTFSRWSGDWGLGCGHSVIGLEYNGHEFEMLMGQVYGPNDPTNQRFGMAVLFAECVTRSDLVAIRDYLDNAIFDDTSVVTARDEVE